MSSTKTSVESLSKSLAPPQLILAPRQEQPRGLADICGDFSLARFEVPITRVTTPAMRLSLIATGNALTVDHAYERAKSNGLCFEAGRAVKRA